MSLFLCDGTGAEQGHPHAHCPTEEVVATSLLNPYRGPYHKNAQLCYGKGTTSSPGSSQVCWVTIKM